MAITDVSDLINRMTGGSSGAPENLWWSKQARIAGAAATATIAGREASLWLYDGQPSAGATPGAVAVPTNATAGALKQTDAGGSLAKKLVGGGITGLSQGTLIIYDRLLHIGGLDGTVTSTQTVGGSITRYTNGVGNFAFAEIYTIIGTTGTTAVINYTDQAGGASVSPAIVFGGTGFREVTRVLRFPLAAGDTGVQGVTNVDLVASTTTAGNFGITIGHPLFFASVSFPGFGPWRSFIDGHGIPDIEDGACLAALWTPIGTVAPELYGPLCFVDA